MNENKFVDFGSRLKTLREERCISQGRFADALGITRQSMSNYENGKHSPDIIAIKKIAEHLECSTDYLLGLTELRNYEVQKEHDKDFARLSNALIGLGHPLRQMWLDTFIGTVEYLGIDAAKDGAFIFDTHMFFRSLMSLVGHCLDTKDHLKNKESDEKGLRKANDTRHEKLCELRTALNILDNISYTYINPPSDEKTGYYR